MPNFNLVNERNNVIQQRPRLTFMTPTPQDNSQANTQNFINFCQTGCQLEFIFANIERCTLNCSNRLFKISVPDNVKTNYILWNGRRAGRNQSGQDLVTYYLKEVYFSLPSKDLINIDSLEKTIQYYFTYTDSSGETMIMVSVIGQANNIGLQSKTNGYRLMETLNGFMPTGNATRDLNNLSNFNLGNLIPNEKAFFTTTIDDYHAQYIILTRIVDVPIDFFNKLVDTLLGGAQAYKTIFDSYRTPPQNPEGTIIFFNEKLSPLGSDEGLVCDKNCNPSVARVQEASVSSVRTTEAPSKPAAVAPSKPTAAAPAAKEEEKCEDKNVEPGKDTAVKAAEKESLQNKVVITFIILTVLAVIFILIFVILMLLKRKFGNIPVLSKAFWTMFRDPALRWWFVFGMVLIANMIISLSVGLGLWVPAVAESLDNANKETYDKSVEQKRNVYLIPLLYGLISTSIGCWLIWAKTPKGAGSVFGNVTSNLTNALGAVQGAVSQGKGFKMTDNLRKKVKYMHNKYPANANLTALRPAVNNTSRNVLNNKEFGHLVSVGSRPGNFMK